MLPPTNPLTTSRTGNSGGDLDICLTITCVGKGILFGYQHTFGTQRGCTWSSSGDTILHTTQMRSPLGPPTVLCALRQSPTMHHTCVLFAWWGRRVTFVVRCVRSCRRAAPSLKRSGIWKGDGEGICTCSERTNTLMGALGEHRYYGKVSWRR